MLSDLEKDKVFWTRKMNLKLVHFMKCNPCMWDQRHPKYGSMKLRNKIYAQFAAKYEYQFSDQAVKDRWTNIRSTFACYVRKVEAAQKLGKEFQVKWHLWDACQYLLQGKKKDILQSQHKEKYVHAESSSEDSIRCDSNMEFEVEDNAEVTCSNVAKSLVTVFQGVQNDSFGIDNSKHGKIGRMVTKKLSQLDSLSAAKAVHEITGILLKYNEENSANMT